MPSWRASCTAWETACGGLQGGNDSFAAGEQIEGIERFRIGDGDVLGAAQLAQMGVLGADGGVVQSGGDRVGCGDLAIVILQHVAVGALQHAGDAAVEARGVIAERFAAAAGFDADESHVFVFDKGGEDADGVGAAADAGDDRIGQAAFALRESARALRRR